MAVTFSQLIGLVIASICICIALLVLTPNKQSATWVFTTVTDGSGWGSKGFSFLLGYAQFAVYRPTCLTNLVSYQLHGQ
jgi:hypothetical protein